MDRLSSARAASRARAPRGGGFRHPPQQPRGGLGGKRVLAGALLADRPRRRPGDPPLRGVEGASGRASDRRRVLRLDLRQLRSRPAGGGCEGGPEAARVHAALRSLRSGVRRRSTLRESGPERGARRRRGGPFRSSLHPGSGTASPEPGTDRNTRGRCRRSTAGRRARRRTGFARISDAQRTSRVLLLDRRRMGLEGVRTTDLHSKPCPSREDGRRPDGPHIDVPAAGPDPHAKRQLQVVGRDRPHQPPLAASLRCAAAGDPGDGRSGTGRDRDRLLRAQGLDHGRDQAGGRGVQSPHGPLEDPRSRSAPADDDREPGPQGLANGRSNARRVSSPILRAIRIRAASGGPMRACIRT